MKGKIDTRLCQSILINKFETKKKTGTKYLNLAFCKQMMIHPIW